MALASRSITGRTVNAADGYPLSVTWYEPVSRPRGTVLIHSAMAVRQPFYRRFAEHLAGAGYRAVTYDYRGIGASRSGSLRGFRATATDWALLDAAAVIAHVQRERTGPLISIGHSFGGQLIGLLDAAADVDAAVLVGAQLGTYRHWPARHQLTLAAMWHAGVPALTALYGYLPGRAGFGGVDLPAGVAREWATWCRSPGYLVDHVPGAAERFAALAAPTRIYSFTDDWYAPQPAVTALVARLYSAPVTHRRIAPADVGVDAIGHFGMFREAVADTLWAELVAHLDEVTTPARAPETPPRLWSITEDEILADLRYGVR